MLGFPTRINPNPKTMVTQPFVILKNLDLQDSKTQFLGMKMEQLLCVKVQESCMLQCCLSHSF